MSYTHAVYICLLLQSRTAAAMPIFASSTRDISPDRCEPPLMSLSVRGIAVSMDVRELRKWPSRHEFNALFAAQQRPTGRVSAARSFWLLSCARELAAI